MLRRLFWILLLTATTKRGRSGARQCAHSFRAAWAVLGESDSGSPSAQPVIAPVLTVPLGSRWLIESRADIRGFVSRPGRQHRPAGRYVEHNARIFAGRLQRRSVADRDRGTIFNERISAIWINKFQNAPIIYPIGTARGYLDGIMTRGTIVSTPDYEINYIAYASVLSTVSNLQSERTAGGRVGVYLPKARLELGSSYQKLLQGNRTNSEGVDVSWQPARVPLEVKAEWAHSESGQGYWFQTSYRLSQFNGADSFIGRFEPVFRMQQFIRGNAVPGDSLPADGAQEPDFGLNYYLPHMVRLHAGYARQFTPLSRCQSLGIWNHIPVSHPALARRFEVKNSRKVEIALACALAVFSYTTARANTETSQSAQPSQAAQGAKSARATSTSDSDGDEGEKRFQSHCGRCHNAPEDLNPRTVKAVVRQMRVRAMLTDEDERLIVKYLAP